MGENNVIRVGGRTYNRAHRPRLNFGDTVLLETEVYWCKGKELIYFTVEHNEDNPPVYFAETHEPCPTSVKVLRINPDAFFGKIAGVIPAEPPAFVPMLSSQLVPNAGEIYQLLEYGQLNRYGFIEIIIDVYNLGVIHGKQKERARRKGNQVAA